LHDEPFQSFNVAEGLWLCLVPWSMAHYTEPMKSDPMKPESAAA